MAERSIHLRGAGVITALGQGVAAQLEPLRTGRISDAVVPQGLKIPPWPYHVIPQLQGHDRLHRMVDLAVQEALDSAGLSESEARNMAVLVGSTCLDLPLHESRYVAASGEGPLSLALRGPGYGNVAADIAERFHWRGPEYTLNTACSSSSNALLHARLLLLEGRVEHAMVIGVESYNRLSVMGFASLQLLSRTCYRPFDRDRDGLLLGEGAGATIWSRSPPADGATLALAGAASACDSSSPTNSRPERICQVMQGALTDAQLLPADLVGIKAHGTGTGSNDRSEALAMQQLGTQLPPLTSLKPYLGHTLGGCGVIELCLLQAAWREGFLPGTPGFEHADPAFTPTPLAHAHPVGPGAMLANTFGFGGNNTSLVLTLQ